MSRLGHAILVALICFSSAPALAITVGVYDDYYADHLHATRISSLGYTICSWTSAYQVTTNSLAGVDVLFVASCSASSLSSKSGIIDQFVSLGGGLIVEQPNEAGPVAIMPSGLEVDVYSRSYTSVCDLALTELGLTHPITASLTPGDMCHNADTVLRTSVSSQFDVLAVQANQPDLVALAVGQYGAGRVIFETGNIHPDSFWPGSDLYVTRMIDWAACPSPQVPEAPAILLALSSGIGALALRRRW